MEDPIEPSKPSYEINDAKDEVNALSKQSEKVEEKTVVKTEEPSKNDSDPKETVPEKKKKPRAQKRIESLSSHNRELQKELDALKAEKKGVKPEPKEVIDPDDFDDYDKYLDALDEQDKAKPSKKEDKPEDNAQKVDVNFQNTLDSLELKFDDTRDIHEDFDDLVRKPLDEGGPALSQTMLEAINEFDNAGDVTYELAKNVTESIRIANLKPMKQILEINKLSAKLTKEAEKAKDVKTVGKKVTNAPDPINPLGGGDTPTNSLADAQSYGDYQKMRSKQNASRNGW